MQKLAIISYFHYEASLCLAKAIAEQGVSVDCYILVDMHHDTGYVPGLDYHRASKRPGLVKLTPESAPEIYNYSGILPITFYLLRIVSYSQKLYWFNVPVFWYTLTKIRSRKYDAINIVGQWPWVEIIHNALRSENITHTFHEVGDHYNGIFSTPLLQAVIRDKSKVILPSNFTYSRFRHVDQADRCKAHSIPFGRFETLLLQRRTTCLNITFDNDYPIFLYYGYIKPYKGLDILARSCEILNLRHVRYNLIVAGGGHDPNLSIFNSMENCKVLNRYLTDEEMLYLNTISDVVLLPYKTASQSGIIPTSFMFGNPIIATDVGALGEMIENDVNGLLVAPNSPTEFADAMNAIAVDFTQLESLRRGAKKFGTNDKYDWRNIAKRTIEVLLTTSD